MKKLRKKFKRESEFEWYCCKIMEEHGLDPRKQNVINYRGRLDRLVLGRFAWVQFVEFKLPGQKLTPLQENEKRNLKRMGFRVVTVDSANKLYRYVINPYLLHVKNRGVKP